MLMIEHAKALGPNGFKVMGADPDLVATNSKDVEEVRARGMSELEVGRPRVGEVIKGERDTIKGRAVGRYGLSPW